MSDTSENMKNTKIVVTLGPATSSLEMIRKLAESGVNVFRCNCSHGSREAHAQNVAWIRQVQEELGVVLGVLFDLQGPKLRIGRFKDDQKIMLKNGDRFQLDLTAEPGSQARVQLPHPEIFSVLKKDMALLLNDGNIRLRVDSFDKQAAKTTVMVGGELSNNKGVNVPGVSLPISALTEKDMADLKMAIDLGADWIGLSFVQRPEDVYMATSLIQGHAGVITKIEKPTAIENLDKIIALADGVMVARGDLGVEASPNMVPVLQKRIVAACRQAGKPVIVATQMLESMISAPSPTRAEASDVATAVYDGADAVMLSAETAVGAYPIESVKMMRLIIQSVERDPLYRRVMEASASLSEHHDVSTAITSAAHQAVKVLDDAKVIVCYTASGHTALMTARERPGVPILCLAEYPEIAQRMALVWGITSVHAAVATSYEEIGELGMSIAKKKGFLALAGDKLVITAGYPFNAKSPTNILSILTLE